MIKVLESGDILLNKYRIEKLYTQKGALSNIFLAKDLVLNYRVIIKQLKPQFFKNEDIISRLKIEAVAQSNLNHPAIVKVIDYDVDNLAIIMEYIDGVELEEFIDVSLKQKIEFFIDILDALSSAHKLSIVHRDLKPSNIFVQKEKFIKLSDFGIAKIVGEENSNLTTVGLGTPLYMSPEQIKGKNITTASDIYSIGVLMYKMVSKKFPLYGENRNATMMKHLSEEPLSFSNLKLNIPKKLETIIFKSLSKTPEDRYQNALELQKALKEFYDSEFFNRKDSFYKKTLILFSMTFSVSIVSFLILYKPTGKVSILTNREANLYVDGKFYGLDYETLKLKVGERELTFDIPNFMKIKNRVQISSDETVELNIVFPDSGNISIIGKNGKRVFIDGKDRGFSPLILELSVGRHIVKIDTIEKEIFILKDKETRINFE